MQREQMSIYRRAHCRRASLGPPQAGQASVEGTDTDLDQAITIGVGIARGQLELRSSVQ